LCENSPKDKEIFLFCAVLLRISQQISSIFLFFYIIYKRVHDVKYYSQAFFRVLVNVVGREVDQVVLVEDRIKLLRQVSRIFCPYPERNKRGARHGEKSSPILPFGRLNSKEGHLAYVLSRHSNFFSLILKAHISNAFPMSLLFKTLNSMISLFLFIISRLISDNLKGKVSPSS
jgi:hypothetical protein